MLQAFTTASKATVPVSRPPNCTCHCDPTSERRSTAVSKAIMPPRSSSSPHSANMKPWLSMMPDSGDSDAPMHVLAKVEALLAQGLMNWLRCSLITNHPNGRRVSVHWLAGVGSLVLALFSDNKSPKW